MSDNRSMDELPEDVLAALRAQRKIEAIKMLRVQRGMDLAEAKRQVDIYIAEHPENLPKRERGEMNLMPLLLAAGVALVAYIAFEYL